MRQKLIKVGNSYAVTIPKAFVDETKWEPGQVVKLETDAASQSITIQLPEKAEKTQHNITPEFYSWLKTFNARYKDVLTELAKK